MHRHIFALAPLALLVALPSCGKKADDDKVTPRHTAQEICARLEKKSYAKNCKKSTSLPAGVDATKVADFYTFDATFLVGNKTWPGSVTAFTSKSAEANRRFAIGEQKEFQTGAGYVVVHVAVLQKPGDAGYESIVKSVREIIE
jgi:predicted small lipoprotein YifL